MGSSGASPSPEELKTLEYTPTWVVAAVCTVIVVISLFAERFLHYLGKFLRSKRLDSLFEALQKLKEELMLLGFISLLLTVTQSLISNMCISPSASVHLLPCKSEEGVHHIKGIFLKTRPNGRRLLSKGADSSSCLRRGKAPLLSLEALHQLHIFIFVLAVVHVGFCAATMVLGGAKIRQWQHWEKEIRKQDMEKEQSKDYTVHSFFKQFYASVTKSDYKALRSGFIMRHCSSNKNFDFHKYMMRALEDDFKIVVGISWYLWLFVVIFLLLNVKGWHTYFWLSFLPLVLLLAVGTKLEHIITKLAHEVAEKPLTDQESPGVKPSDHHFWFRRPGIVLYLIHFILFQNAFELAFFIWIWVSFGLK
ncbi:MLO-like protein 1 [Apostasia shenzhenica]|uniref:MLO-like protein 1 n=1 Tax=Apostasia shenzhenica TaxID=1088818 RepID=A0A2I0A6S8_9ASPA|nr:MLO-like protein 1 [Apostasia shenzhenica]